jgi:ABC-type glutathione transport system ATPase component
MAVTEKDVMAQQEQSDGNGAPPTGGTAQAQRSSSGSGGQTEYVVRAKDLVKEFQMGQEVTRALNGVSLDIKRGEYISIMGPSGSGKSTFFNMIGGLDKPNKGSVFINDVDMAQLDAQELAFLRCHTIGYIFQTFNLIPVMTALENVQLPTIFAGKPSEDGTARAIELLEIVGLGHRCTTSPRNYPAASSSASPSPGALPTTRPSCSPTSRPATWTRRPAKRSSRCSES